MVVALPVQPIFETTVQHSLTCTLQLGRTLTHAARPNSGLRCIIPPRFVPRPSTVGIALPHPSQRPSFVGVILVPPPKSSWRSTSIRHRAPLSGRANDCPCYWKGQGNKYHGRRCEMHATSAGHLTMRKCASFLLRNIGAFVLPGQPPPCPHASPTPTVRPPHT